MRLIDADALVDALMMHTWYDEDERIIDDDEPKREYIKGWLPDISTVSGWISVKDRRPEKAGIYIICDHYGNVMSRHFCKGYGRFSGYWHFNGSAKYGNPRYWMPMPEPPKEVEECD